ncbi:cytochrome c biogenesis protein ResB [Streptomyces sp. B1866]|uniref:cytochrome c biogenesis protein ResB n=1 Tax=Streptomyces sp. B1866 TaxID=3075431 RepID=UPI00288CACCB|nr:cytochrome c biogenesis protein ResB [Streptomyces sp. B1866]MDT3396103.1 cytochrome c biogenesis protein ResB [Streptomyces sp. B1866]
MSTTETGSAPADTGAGDAADAAADAGQAAEGQAADQGQVADARELGAAGAQLSTAPAEDVHVPSLGPLGWARWFWRQLTSMRVALLLLFLLSLGSIPGSLIPQTRTDPVKVEDFKDRHPDLAPVYEKLGLFHVYSSVWFSAIYILLFVSLVGCIVPRTWQFVGQLRGRPPAAPRRLTRLPAYTTWTTDADPGRVLDAARQTLAGRRFRVHRHGDAVGAEKGYLREAGNLLFHVALIVMLVAFAAGQLWKSEGGKLVVEGEGFSNTLTQYDDFTSGALFKAEDLDPFGFQLDGFSARYERTGPNRGTPREYRAHVTYWKGADGARKKKDIQVNKPLKVGGSKVFLLSRGYAPVVTVRDGSGQIAYQGAVPFLQQDNNLTSSGVVKVPDARDRSGRKDQLGFQGFFVPTFIGGQFGMFSQFPALDNPALFLTAFHGSLGLDGGTPQNVYQLDTSRMKQFKDAEGQNFARRLVPGETMTLPGGAGTLRFDGVRQWASFQISHQPGNGWALAGAVAALAGLAASLFIRRRRVWVRAVPDGAGGTLVEMGGLGRSESARLPEEIGDLALAVQAEVPPVPVREPEPDPGAGPGADAGPEPETDAGPEPGAGPGPEADARPRPGADARPRPEAAPGPEPAGPQEEDVPEGEDTPARTDPSEPSGPAPAADPADPSEGARA